MTRLPSQDPNLDLAGHGLSAQQGLQQFSRTGDKMSSKPSTFERSWPTIILAPIQVSNYIITVSSTDGLHTKQEVVLSKLAARDKFMIKRILSDTQLQVGPIDDGNMAYYSNPTQYDGGTLVMSEFQRNKIGSDIVIRAVYEEEPAVAFRNILVDKFGAKIDAVLGPDNVRRLGVDPGGAQVNITNNLLNMMVQGPAVIDPTKYIINNDHFFIFDNEGNLIRAG